MSRRAWGWAGAVAVAAGAYLYGAVAPGPPRTNADRVHALARGFACPVCAGQSVAESDVPVAREIRRQIGIWVDEGRSDDYIRDELVAAYDIDIDYNPSGAGSNRPGVGAAGRGRAGHGRRPSRDVPPPPDRRRRGHRRADQGRRRVGRARHC